MIRKINENRKPESTKKAQFNCPSCGQRLEMNEGREVCPSCSAILEAKITGASLCLNVANESEDRFDILDVALEELKLIEEAVELTQKVYPEIFSEDSHDLSLLSDIRSPFEPKGDDKLVAVLSDRERRAVIQKSGPSSLCMTVSGFKVFHLDLKTWPDSESLSNYRIESLNVAIKIRPTLYKNISSVREKLLSAKENLANSAERKEDIRELTKLKEVMNYIKNRYEGVGVHASKVGSELEAISPDKKYQKGSKTYIDIAKYPGVSIVSSDRFVKDFQGQWTISYPENDTFVIRPDSGIELKRVSTRYTRSVWYDIDEVIELVSNAMDYSN